MKILKKISLVFVFLLCLAIPARKVEASVESEKQFLTIDTKRHRDVLKRVNQAIKEGKVKGSKQKIEKLKETIKSMDDLLNQVERLQEIYRENIRIRDQIRPHLQNRDTYFSVDIGRLTTNKRISDLFIDVAKEDDYFYYGQYASAKVDTTYNPAKSRKDKTFIEKAKFDVKYRVGLDREYATSNFVKKWVSENIDPSLTEYAKVKAIHDFIVKKNYYNKGDRNEESGGISIYHPASILFGNGGVCNAYATLFDLMAKQAGLETRFLTGKSLKNGEDHMWNMVKIMGNWYHIDTTWDDPIISFKNKDIENLGDFVIYDYFLKSDAEIKKSRTINESKTRPQAKTNFPPSPANLKIEEIDVKYYVK
ncbi:transglutaminase domain-containing protein [uncultured Anaerococcus sp.]|uniref:transglutaminase domain-containing protein n=1 Tax=uncultured Anaerococcus sp. TaxID=293428 RepID=UPI00288A078C|nr:transglutaminase domain-containing protein [uncultured Anaerococcus sp.]